MSRELTVIKKTGKKDTDLQVTQFYGGDKKGIMIQLTQGFGLLFGDNDEPGFIQLTRQDVKKLIKTLRKWKYNS